MEETKGGWWRGLSRLTRFPLGLSAVTNVAAGYVVAASWSGVAVNWNDLLLLFFISFCLYSGGLVFNDVYDFAGGADAGRNRPLPRGLVRLDFAVTIGGLFFLLALLFSQAVSLSAVFITVFIILTALLYNSWSKRLRLLGSLNMAVCRGLNFALGFTASSQAMNLFVTPGAMFYPVLLAIYVFFVTVLSTSEDDLHLHAWRWFGGGGIFLMLAVYAFFLLPYAIHFWYSLLCLLGTLIFILPFGLLALGTHSRIDTGKFVGASVTAIMLLDAAVIFAFARDASHLLAGVVTILCFITLLTCRMLFAGKTE